MPRASFIPERSPRRYISDLAVRYPIPDDADTRHADPDDAAVPGGQGPAPGHAPASSGWATSTRLFERRRRARPPGPRPDADQPRRDHPDGRVPATKLEHYLGKLLHAGHRVAVCDQVEDAGRGKGLIRREVTRVVTPGTVTEDELLDPRRPNHLVAVCPVEAGDLGLAWVGPVDRRRSTPPTCPRGRLADELARLAAAECLLPRRHRRSCSKLALGPTPPRAVTARPDWTFDPTTAPDALKRHFQVATLAGFGFDDDQPCLAAAGALLALPAGDAQGEPRPPPPAAAVPARPRT